MAPYSCCCDEHDVHEAGALSERSASLLPTDSDDVSVSDWWNILSSLPLLLLDGRLWHGTSQLSMKATNAANQFDAFLSRDL